MFLVLSYTANFFWFYRQIQNMLCNKFALQSIVFNLLLVKLTVNAITC